MTRKLECIRKNEVGQVIRAGHSFCRYVAKPLTATVCNEDKHCDRKWSPNTHYFLFYGSYFNRRYGAYLFEQGESKTVLDSGLHAVDSGFQVLVSRFSVSGSRIPDFNHSRFFELHGGFPHMRRYEGIVQVHITQTKGKNCPLACAHSEVYFTFLTVFSKNSLSVLLYHIVKLDFSRSC